MHFQTKTNINSSRLSYLKQNRKSSTDSIPEKPIPETSVSQIEAEMLLDDVFNTISLAKEIICPVFVVHGKLDNVIPIEHSYDIVKQLKNSMTWYPNKATHSNLTTLYRQKYYAKLKTFLKFVEENYSKVNRIRLDSVSQSKLDSTVIDLLCLKK